MAATCLAITFLADVRWGFFGGIFAAAYGLAHFPFIKENLRQAILPGLGAGLLAVNLTAGLTLPMAEFMSLSRRAALTSSDSGAYSI